MNAKRLALLGVVALAAGIALIVGCGKTNTAPVVSSIVATPADSALVGSSILLKPVATDEDDDPLTFTWSTTSGTLSGTTGDSVTWTPTAAGACTVACICADGNEGEDTATVTLKGYQVWQFNSVQGETPDSTYLPAAATTYVPFELDDIVPPGAQLESAFVCTDLEPDTVGEFFRIWVVTPGGSEVLVYDGLNGEPDVDDVLIQGVKGEDIKGTWQLKVVRDASPIERYADVCDIDIYYRY